MLYLKIKKTVNIDKFYLLIHSKVIISAFDQYKKLLRCLPSLKLLCVLYLISTSEIWNLTSHILTWLVTIYCIKQHKNLRIPYFAKTVSSSLLSIIMTLWIKLQKDNYLGCFFFFFFNIGNWRGSSDSQCLPNVTQLFSIQGAEFRIPLSRHWRQGVGFPVCWIQRFL